MDAAGTLDQGGLFDFRSMTRFGYAWDAFNVGLSWRHLSSVKASAAATSPDTNIRGTGSYDMFNLHAGYVWNDTYSLRFGIDNLLDSSPRIIGANPGVDSNSNQTNPAFYDALGRRYYVGLRMSF